MPEAPPYLTIAPPPMRRAGAIAISALALTMLTVFTMRAMTGSAATGEPAALVACGLLGLFFLCVLFQNIFYAETICFVRDGEMLPEIEGELIRCDDIVSVRQLPAPRSLSLDWHIRMWGFGRDRLVIETKNGPLFFGAGLSDDEARRHIGRLEAYCGRALNGGTVKMKSEASR